MHGCIRDAAPEWAREQFGTARLGDLRRVKRAVAIGAGMARRANASIPMQSQTAKDTKAAYRFFDQEGVTFEALARPHWELTRRAIASEVVVLVLQDTTAISLSGRHGVTGLGPIGDRRRGQGLLLHNALAVVDGPEARVLGLAYQEIWARTSAPEGETENQRRKRSRESERWWRTIRQIGALGPCRVVHVCDREGDIFEVYEACAQTGAGFLVRVGGNDRSVRAGHGPDAEETGLLELAHRAPACASKAHEIRSRPGCPARTADLLVSRQPVTLLPSRLRDRRGRKGVEPVRAWLVRVWEPAPPPGVEAIEWMLVTSEPVETPEAALRAAEWYARRWLIEEYHKCLKTGCGAEDRQLESADRLKPLIAMLGVTAVRLLSLKLAARSTPEAPARGVVPEEYVEVLSLYRGEAPSRFTCRHFWRSVAMLGGFIGRRSDGDPGWLTLWRGWKQLELLVDGARLGPLASAQRCGE